MATSNSNDYCGSFTDDDSGIGIDYGYASSNDLNSSMSTLIESSPSYSSQVRMTSTRPPAPSTTVEKRFYQTPLIKFTSDGVVERIRPSTMKNSQNGDFVLCRTNRGTYVAYRTPAVPQWIKRLVEEIQFRQQ